MGRYSYDGPVVEFGVCVQNNWHGETVAMSERKARSNLAYQWKKKYNRIPAAKISFPGKITVEEF